jgi:hypothetical protein
MNAPRVQPKRIISPISGVISDPKLVEKRIGDKIYTEAVWYDSQTGQFIRRGIVKIVDAQTGKEI